jgi:hypothetical protein
MAAKTLKLELTADTGPAEMILDLLIRHADLAGRKIDPVQVPEELFRIEHDPCPAGADELRVVLYPSDGLLRFAAAVFAGKADFSGVQ